MFVADTGNNAVDEVTPTGGTKAFAIDLDEPDAVAVDANDDVYIGDFDGGVREFSPSGDEWIPIGSGIASPTGLAASGNGDVFLATSITVESIRWWMAGSDCRCLGQGSKRCGG